MIPRRTIWQQVRRAVGDVVWFTLMFLAANLITVALVWSLQWICRR